MQSKEEAKYEVKDLDGNVMERFVDLEEAMDFANLLKVSDFGRMHNYHTGYEVFRIEDGLKKFGTR